MISNATKRTILASFIAESVSRSIDRYSARLSGMEVDHYAKRKSLRTDQPHLFDSHDDLGMGHWITIGGDKGPSGSHEGGHAVFVGEDGKMKTGKFAGQTMKEAFSKDSKSESEPPTRAEPTFQTIPLRERKAYAQKLAQDGMKQTEIADHLMGRGVASVDARKLASDATFEAGILAEEAAKQQPEESVFLKEKKNETNEKPGDSSPKESETEKRAPKFDPDAIAKAARENRTSVWQQSKAMGHGSFAELTDEKQKALVAAMDRNPAKSSDQPKPPSEARAAAMEKAKAKQAMESKPIAVKDTPALTKAFADSIADFGEKIGGARKDTAAPLGPRPKKEKPVDDRPAWKRKYHVAEDANRPGEYFVVNSVTQQPFGPGDVGRSSSSFSSMLAKRLGKRGLKPSDFKNFSSKEDAENAVAQIEVSRNHGVKAVRGKDGKPESYAIYRRVTDKKHPIVKGGFDTHQEAEIFMMEKDPQSIIEHEFPDWEDYSYLDNVTRKGKEHRPGGKDVKPSDFQEAFNFRGGEFGKWQMNQDGQTSLNHAYDALHDLADVVGLPPRAMSLNGKLAIAFGSRGTGGKHSAKAHYEPEKEVINLTKMKGAGSLAHEWFHALDHYMAQQVHGVDKNGKKTESLLSEHLPYGKGHKGRHEVVDAWRNLVNTMNSKTVDEKIQGNDKQLSNAKKTVESVVDELDKMLESNKQYNKRHKVLNEEQRKEWDSLKEKIKNLEVGSKTSIDSIMRSDKKLSGFALSPSTYEPLQKLNELYKKATGRSFHTADRDSHGNRIYWAIWRAQNEAEKIAKASEGESMTKKKSTQFQDDSHALDKFRTGQYYAKDIEMAARAFQGYIYDKTEGVGKPSQYLNGKAHNKYYAGLFTEEGEPYRPFPEGEERTAINKAFDQLFETIKHRDREDEKGQHVELYSALSDLDSWYLRYDAYDEYSVDQYRQWDPSLHPRDEMGRFAENERRSTRVRELAAAPDQSMEHSLHLKKQSNEHQIRINDLGRSMRSLWNEAVRKSGTEWKDNDSEEQIWNNVDKSRLQSMLGEANQLDKDSNGRAADVMNYNQIIPRQIAERLQGGSRFFDPEKLRGRWNESQATATQTGSDGDSTNDHHLDEPENVMADEPTNQPPKSFDDLRQAFKQAFAPKYEDVSTKKLNQLDATIRSTISDRQDIIDAFQPMVVQAWREMSREAEDHNSAMREITNAAKNYLDSKGYNERSQSRSPQSFAAMVRRARQRTMDPTKEKGFDEIVDRAEKQFPHLIQGRGEDGLIDLLAEGLKRKPDLLSQEVATRAMDLAGASFFDAITQASSGQSSPAPSTSSEWEDPVPFSWSDQYSAPTEAQREAGNYRKKHIRLYGLDISIETPRGQRRRPEWPTMKADYGYIRGTTGKDGDSLDVFIGPSPTSELVYVIDQVGLNGKFDEHKIMLGFTSRDRAIRTYRLCYTRDWKVGPVTTMTIEQFKNWIESGKHRLPIERQVSKYSMQAN
jgi:hypothetical protein